MIPCCRNHGTPATTANIWFGNAGHRHHVDYVCDHCASELATHPAVTGEECGARWRVFQPIVRPDTATPEQLVCVEVLLIRFCNLFRGECP